MYPRSSKMDKYVIGSHRVKMYATVHTPGATVAFQPDQDSPLFPAATTLATLDIIDGQITIDDVDIRRQADIDLVDRTGTITPETGRDLLAPRVNEVRLWRGVVYPDGTEEVIPQGVYFVTDIAMDDSGPSVHISVTLKDRAVKVISVPFTADTGIAAGTTVVNAIEQVLQGAVPTYVKRNFTGQGHSFTVPAMFIEAGEDRWAMAQDIASDHGMELFFDANGELVLQNVPDYDTLDPVWNFEEGKDCTTLYVNRRLTEEGVANWIIVIGTNSDNANVVRGDAQDLNPASSTYIYGPYGMVIEKHDSSTVADNSAATAAANGILQKKIGLGELIRFQAIVHPAMNELGDVITLNRDVIKASGRGVIDKLSIPMTVDRAMDISLRRRTV